MIKTIVEEEKEVKPKPIRTSYQNFNLNSRIKTNSNKLSKSQYITLSKSEDDKPDFNKTQVFKASDFN